MFSHEQGADQRLDLGQSKCSLQDVKPVTSFCNGRFSSFLVELLNEGIFLLWVFPSPDTVRFYASTG